MMGEKKEGMMELFSVIILVYNNSVYLTECIDSVLMQTYPNIELIIADDHSHCFDEEYFKDYIQKHKRSNISSFVVYSNEENLGTVKNINCALKKCSGRYIKPIAGDDALADELTLINAGDALNQAPDHIITSKVIRCDPKLSGNSLYKSKLQEDLNSITPLECFKRLCIHNDIIAGGVFYKREFFEKFGYFDENYRLLEDWPMWLKVTGNDSRIMYADFFAIRYRANVGFGTSVNSQYMEDKKRVLKTIIMTNKEKIGWKVYVQARLYFRIINSKFIRKLYGLLFRSE